MAWHDGLDRDSPAFLIASERNSPIHVLAGPGTGKSYALQRRVARLLEEGVPAGRILAVTFTRTAARDLRREVTALDVPGCEKVQACTLHSLCFEILMGQHVLGILNRVPRVLMDFERKIIPRDNNASEYGSLRERGDLLKAYEAAWARLERDQPGWPLNPVDRGFARDVDDWLSFHECMLLGELVPQTLAYLRDNPLSPILGRFTHLLVDEYQDLNRADQATIDLLSEGGSLLVVGDDDQSIFRSLRYANPEGIVEFPDTHPGTVSFRLEECRRCPCRVVRVANFFIGQGRGRPDRCLGERARNGEGEMNVIQWADIDAEVVGLARIVNSCVTSGEVEPADVLVLCPWHVIGHRIRNELEALGTHACSHFQESALESSVARERFEVLTLLANPRDRMALRYLLGYGSPNHGASAYGGVRWYCVETGTSPWDAVRSLALGEIQIPGTARLVEQFRRIDEATRVLSASNPDEFLDSWLGDADGVGDLRELSRQALKDEPIARLLDEWIPGPVGDNPGFLEMLRESLRTVITQPELPSEDNAVKVMSLQKSKGLRAALVVVAGCIDGWIPRVDTRLTPAEQIARLEEQRRLFYVALTRTTHRLILSSAQRMSIQDAKRSYASIAQVRRRRGGVVYAEVVGSRFLGRQLGPDCPPAVSGTSFLAGM